LEVLFGIATLAIIKRTKINFQWINTVSPEKFFKNEIFFGKSLKF